MRLLNLIKDLILLELHKHHKRLEDSRWIELYHFPVIGTQIRKE